MKADLVYLRGSQIVFYILPDMLSKAPMFNRITLWKKYKGHPPQVGIAKGQSAAIVKKCTMLVQSVLACLLVCLTPVDSSCFLILRAARQRRMQMQTGGDRGPRQR